MSSKTRVKAMRGEERAAEVKAERDAGEEAALYMCCSSSKQQSEPLESSTIELAMDALTLSPLISSRSQRPGGQPG